MFFHLKSLIYAILFFIITQIILIESNLIWYVIFFLILLAVTGAKRIGGKKKFSIIPILFSFSSVVLLYLIDSTAQRSIFSIISAMAYYFIFLGIYRLRHYDKDKTAQGIFSGGLAIAMFFFYAGFYGLYINFSIPLWFFMALFLTVTFVTNFHYFSFVSENKKKVLIYSLIFSMAITEISWVVNFWPFGYLTTGVITLIFYYVFWDLTQSYFSNKLSKKRFLINLMVSSLLIGIILLTSKWQLAL